MGSENVAVNSSALSNCEDNRVKDKSITYEHLVIGGGVIPDADIPGLKAAGIAEVFTPGTPTGNIVEFINANVK